MAEKNNNAPPSTLTPSAAIEAWGRNEKPRLDRDRYAILAILGTVSSCIMAAAVVTMLPLKTTVPWIIETDRTGKTTIAGPALDAFNPTQAQIIYFIRQWTEQLWSVDPALTKRSLEVAYAMTRGKAADVFRQHVANYRAIERSASDSSLSVSVQVQSVNFVSSQTAIVRFSTTERKTNKPPEETFYSMTLHWAISPSNKVEDIMINPIGFYITDFSWTKEVTNGS